jgi:hypothetical protein
MDVVIVHIATLWPVSEYAYENAAIRAWRMRCLSPAVPVALQHFCGKTMSSLIISCKKQQEQQ